MVHKPRESTPVRLDLVRASGVRLFNHKILYIVRQVERSATKYSNYCGSWSGAVRELIGSCAGILLYQGKKQDNAKQEKRKARKKRGVLYQN